MDIYKQACLSFLAEIGYQDSERLIAELDAYRQTLNEVNKITNLVSRKMPIDWYWTHHFLDSLIALKCMDFSGKSVLDFGTGGGIPGLPLKFAVPDMKLVMLDATNRKIDALQEILRRLNLDEKMAVCARLEDYSIGGKSFDYVICRAVAIEPRYLEPLRRLLKPKGKLICFKAQKIDDISHLVSKTELEMQIELLGYRRIISIDRKDLK